MSRPRLLHVFSTFDAGGPQVRTARLMGFAGAEFEHVVVAMDGRYGCAERVPASVPVRYEEAPRGAGPWTALALLARLRAVSPQLVLTYNWGAIEAVLACRFEGGVPLVHHEDGFGPEEARKRKRRRSLARRVLLDGASRVVVPSRVLERVAREEWGVEPARLRCVPNGVDAEFFAPGSREEARGELGVPADALVFGAVGHLRGEKDHANLLRAFARLPGEPVLLLAGDGPERPALESMAAESGLGERVRFLGFRGDPRAIYRACDVYVLPSRTEQMPVGLLEAMACARPVVATDVGDVREILGPIAARQIVPKEDAARLAEAMRELAEDAGLRAELGSAMRARVQAEFTELAMCRAHVAEWREWTRA